MYQPERQYRCTIIRARAISEADDLLPMYAAVIDRICPCTKEEFERGFNSAFRDYAESKARNQKNERAIKKTLDNHRTEVSGSLFGMHYEIDGIVYASERTKKFLQDHDQPAFFKDWLLKMQFPNGMQKAQTYMKAVADGLKCHPYSILLKVLDYAQKEDIVLLKKEIGYYILNSEDVLKGKAAPKEIFDKIIDDKRKGTAPKKIEVPEGETKSKYYQHITDQLQYLQLANLIILDGQKVKLNPNEDKAIKVFEELWNQPLGFDMYSFDIKNISERKRLEEEWAVYYGKLSEKVDLFDTSVEALMRQAKVTVGEQEKNKKLDKMELGDAGEQYVYEYEKRRVGEFNPRLVNKVLALGKTKGLGYDIQSVIAEKGELSEFVKYIEVKSTKRVTAPDINIKDSFWMDTVNLTRNEWIAALQHKEFYYIYRVYFVRGGVVMYVIKNIYEKKESGRVEIVPMTYRVDFQNSAVDEVIEGVIENV